MSLLHSQSTNGSNGSTAVTERVATICKCSALIEQSALQATQEGWPPFQPVPIAGSNTFCTRICRFLLSDLLRKLVQETRIC